MATDAPYIDQEHHTTIDRLATFLDAGITKARELRRGISTEDARRGYSQEEALQEVRREFVGCRLPNAAELWQPDARPSEA